MPRLATYGQRLAVVAILVMVIWVVEGVNVLLGHRLNLFGIYPRSLAGLSGIVLAPVLHVNPAHALANTVPLLVLGWLVSLHGRARFIRVAVVVSLLTGSAVWLFARSAYHVGASGLVFGLFGYVLGRAWWERSWPAILSAAAAVALYGGLVWGIVPARAVSFESHLFGLLAGVAMAWFERGRRR